MMVLGGGAFESEAFIHEISILKKETLKSSLAPSTIWGNRMKVPAMNQEEGLQQNLTVLETLVLNFLACRMMEIIFLFINYPECGILL